MIDTASDYVRIFDTTLRDGEQSPGASMATSQKLEVARALARLGVDIIEAGFPIASPDDFSAVRKIAETIGVRSVEGRPSDEPPVICALARTARADIERAWEAIQVAKHPRIHTFLATSELHMRHKLRMTRQEVLARVEEMVGFARERCQDVEFSPEDAGRSDPEFLYQVLAVAIRAGATTLNIPDTVGYTTPDEYGALIAGIKANTPGIERAVISVHCHDDLGLATANTLAGIRAGARQAEVTINGIGERAGNCSLEEIAMALATRRPLFELRTGIDSTQLTRASRLVSSCTGIVVQPNKAIVGANAFAHESGIHQDGMLKHQETYEIMRPEAVGAGDTALVLGKHSGRHALGARLAAMGFALDAEALDKAFARFKQLADKRKCITDADLETLITTEIEDEQPGYTLESIDVLCGTTSQPTALVCLRGPDSRPRRQEATGTGPVDAAYRAIDRIIGVSSVLLEYHVQSVTSGIDAQGQVSVRIRPTGTTDGGGERSRFGARSFHGHGADTDIVVASVHAYLHAKNRLFAAQVRAALRPGAPKEAHDGTHAV